MFVKIIESGSNAQPNNDPIGVSIETLGDATCVRLMHPKHNAQGNPSERLPVSLYSQPVNRDDLSENKIGDFSLALGEVVYLKKKSTEHIFFPYDGFTEAAYERVFYTNVSIK